MISGTFEILSRETIKLVVENGGKLSSVVNSKTKTIGGQSIGPSKKRKAELLSIPIISENDFLEMINANEHNNFNIIYILSLLVVNCFLNLY